MNYLERSMEDMVTKDDGLVADQVVEALHAEVVPSSGRRYFAPTRPYSVTDAVRRAAVATSPPARTPEARDADYNGHRIFVSRRRRPSGRRYPSGTLVRGVRGTSVSRLGSEEARVWDAAFPWNGVSYVARGTDFERALFAAVMEYGRGARGSSVVVDCQTEGQCRLCEAVGFLSWSPEAEGAALSSWYTPLHAEAGRAVAFDRRGAPAALALSLSTSVEDYESKLSLLVASGCVVR